MTGYPDETELDVIIDGIQGINDAADAMERAASRMQASADGIAAVADRAAESAAAKVSEAASEALADFRRESALAQARLDEAVRGVEAAKKALSRLVAVLAVLTGATIAATYAVTSAAVEQVEAANASIEQTNELVQRVNDSMNLALPQVQPIGGGLSSIIMSIYNDILALAAIAFAVWVAWAIHRFLIKGRRL